MLAARRLPLLPLLACALLATAPPARGDDPKEAKPPPPKEARAELVAPPRQTELTILEGGKPGVCREQTAQPFLVRGNWFPKTTDADEVKQGRKWLDDAIRYRTEKYGYFEGFGSPKWNRHPPRHFAKTTTFLGLNVTVHERIIPALKCVEAALKASHADAEYTPKTMGGIRFRNTYRGVEVSNHVYGIAVDIEPDRNTCCGCVAPWNAHPLCKKKVQSVYERMAMPKSWVEAFERYGFYWLGHDVLADTMHFEFLGDPEKIVAAAGPS
jgi:hypothetical protein